MTKKVIMIVDDDTNILYAVKQGVELESDDYEVVTAESGNAAIQLLREVRPDVILMDLMMPELSGWETFDLIKQQDEYRNIPVIFVSARTDDFAKKSCRFLGEDFIEKPFLLTDLMQHIEQVIDRSEQKE